MPKEPDQHKTFYVADPRDLDVGRRLTRRRTAVVAFVLLALEASFLWGSLLWHPERTAIAAAFGSAWPVLAGTQGALLTIILGYLGVSVAEKVWAK